MSDDSICPICKDYLLEPRIYECGHTICESCMIKSDKTVKENTLNTFQLPVYKCCLCRHETLKEWFRRPINHNLQCILMKDDEYKEASEIYKKNKEQKDPEDDTIPQGVNFAVRTTMLTNLLEVYGVSVGERSNSKREAEVTENAVVLLTCE